MAQTINIPIWAWHLITLPLGVGGVVYGVSRPAESAQAAPTEIVQRVNTLEVKGATRDARIEAVERGINRIERRLDQSDAVLGDVKILLGEVKRALK